MDAAARSALEREVAGHLLQREIEAAAEKLIRGYGPEVLGFLCAVLDGDDIASDAFAQACEDVWRGLPSLVPEVSLRAWLYTVARHAAWRTLKRDRRQREALPLSLVASRLQAEVRTATLPHLRSAARDRLRALRSALPLPDQMLLILRVDKRLQWNELAVVLRGDEPLDEGELKREAARLRKRFQLVKDELREAARREGLLDEI